jgi:hypothetical protein
MARLAPLPFGRISKAAELQPIKVAAATDGNRQTQAQGFL